MSTTLMTLLPLTSLACMSSEPLPVRKSRSLTSFAATTIPRRPQTTTLLAP